MFYILVLLMTQLERKALCVFASPKLRSVANKHGVSGHGLSKVGESIVDRLSCPGQVQEQKREYPFASLIQYLGKSISSKLVPVELEVLRS